MPPCFSTWASHGWSSFASLAACSTPRTGTESPAARSSHPAAPAAPAVPGGSHPPSGAPSGVTFPTFSTMSSPYVMRGSASASASTLRYVRRCSGHEVASNPDAKKVVPLQHRRQRHLSTQRAGHTYTRPPLKLAAMRCPSGDQARANAAPGCWFCPRAWENISAIASPVAAS